MMQEFPIEIADELKTISQEAGLIRSKLIAIRGHLPPNILEDLSSQESRVFDLSKKAMNFINERKNLLAISEIGKAINSSLNLDEVLRIVMDNIIQLTAAERGFLMLHDPNGNMTTRVARNWEQESLNETEYAVSRTIIQRVIDSGEPVLTTNAQQDPRFGNQNSIIAFNLRSIICVPLNVTHGQDGIIKKDLIGVIYADNRIRSGIFSDSEKDLLVIFANQAAIAIENARLFETLSRTLSEVTEIKKMMDNIFSSIPSGVITTDIDDLVLLVNPAAERIIGLSSLEMVGKKVCDLFPSISGSINDWVAQTRNHDQNLIDLEFSHHIGGKGLVTWRVNMSPLKNHEKLIQGVAIVLDDLTEKKRLELHRKWFERMVSPAVIEQLNPENLELGGRKSGITTLFADIRGFATYSESQSPEKLVAVLNRYLAAAADAILEEEGTVDKFLGDAVMAWLNAPIPQPDHAIRAVRAAINLRKKVTDLYKVLSPESYLEFGVGINFGDAVLGLIGTDKHQEYTAIGDSVNTAKRIQENSGKNQIIISESVYELVKDKILVNPLPPMVVKGKRSPLIVFELIGLR